jgi:glycosyltransferase involved in cell wall biosynthesis
MPCYNESSVIPHSLPKVRATLANLIQQKAIGQSSKILFVDDGSTDGTWQIIKAAAKKDKMVAGIKLAANSGHQMAMLAGMHTAQKSADIVVTMDVDLQDDLGAIKEMVAAHQNGAEIVYGVRNDRSVDQAHKKWIAAAFYKFMQHMGAKTIYNHADFRLMTSAAIKKLAAYESRGMQLRGIIPSMGLKSSTIYYKRQPREHGQPRYTLLKLATLAMDGITQFTIKPIQWLMIIGLIGCAGGVIGMAVLLIQFLVTQNIAGWSLVICSIWFWSGVQLLAIWLVGEYIGRTHRIVQQGPLYNINETTGGIKNE